MQLTPKRAGTLLRAVTPVTKESFLQWLEMKRLQRAEQAQEASKSKKKGADVGAGLGLGISRGAEMNRFGTKYALLSSSSSRGMVSLFQEWLLRCPICSFPQPYCHLCWGVATPLISGFAL